MNYQGKLPERNSNVSHEHPLREFFILVLGAVGVLLLIYTLLGLSVDLAVDAISPEMESEIYRSVHLKMLDNDHDGASVSPKELATQQLLDQLSQCTDIGYPIHLNIEESELNNAYALPGGDIVVYSGLMDKLKSENGLAFVLAHEIAHFKNRDHLRSMGRGVVLVALSALFVGSDSEFLKFVSPVSQLDTAQFSQEREFAADATALQILNCYYGHIGGATEFFETLENSGETFDIGINHYFSSHPEIQARIDNIHRLARLRGYKLDKPEKITEQSQDD